MAVTTRRHLPYPIASDSADVPRDISALANSIDDIAFDKEGLASARPAAASTLPGTYYYSTDTGVVSRSVGTGMTSSSWVNISYPKSTVSALPGSPADGDICFFQNAAMATDGQMWMLRYRSGGGTYKWEFVGGTPISSEIATTESLTGAGATTYGALTTAGPTCTVPLAGDYVVGHGAAIYAQIQSYMSYQIGATVATDADAVLSHSGSGNYQSVMREKVKTALPASTALVAKYRNASTSTSVQFQNRWMRITPIRVG